MRKNKLILFLLLCLLGQTLGGCTLLPTQEQNFELQSFLKGTIASYILEAEESFTVKAVDDVHKEAVDASIAEFEADLENGNVDLYYTNPSFSILLSAGSEGNYFNSAEGIEQIMESGAVFSQAVVFNPGVTAPDIYKGQFYNGRFYFDNNVTGEILPENTTYLIALNPSLETQAFKGQLSAGSEGNYLSAGSEGNYLSAGSEGNFLDSSKLQKTILDSSKLQEPVLDETVLQRNTLAYQNTLNAYQKRATEYASQVEGVNFVVVRSHPWAYTQTFAYLSRAYPDEFILEHDLVRGLPKGLLNDAFKNMLDRLSKRWLDDCGYPVPDDGSLFLQVGARNSPIPLGYHTEELSQVIDAIPELREALDAKFELPPPQRYPEGGFDAFIESFREKYPSIFERYQWHDKFAPPACVNPYEDQGGVRVQKPPPPRPDLANPQLSQIRSPEDGRPPEPGAPPPPAESEAPETLEKSGE